MADPSSCLNSNPSKWSLLQIGALSAFSSIGYAGMTSLPYYVQAHTGLFFVAFYLLLILICIPVCYVQIKLGALYGKGVLGICSYLVPILKGVAVALLIMTYFRSITHAVEMTYGVYYMFASCQQPFPWQEKPLKNLSISSHEAKITIFDSVKTTSEDTYFMQEVIQRSPHVGSMGPLVWYLVLCAAFVWLLVFFVILKGSAGLVKAMSVLAPVTGCLILILMVYGFVSVPDASKKLYHIWARTGLTKAEGYTSRTHDHTNSFTHFLSRPKIWLDALDLHVYGLGLWAGSLPFLGAHIACKKKVINATGLVLLGLYSLMPHLLMVMMVPYMDPFYPGGTLDYEVGIKPGMSLLFISIPHVFRQQGLSPFIAFLLYLTYILIGLQHLTFHMLMIWENIWPSIPKAAMAFFKRTPFLLAAFCFLSFLFTIPYTSQCGIYLYQIIRHYVDRLLFCLVIYNMVPFVIGFIRQEAFRTPIDRVFMAVWYAAASVVAACLLLYNFVVFVYPEAVVAYEQRWAEQLGWLVSILPLLMGVLVGAAHTVWTQQGGIKERIKGSIRVGSPPPDEYGDDCLSVGTGDTDLKTPGPSRHNTPLAQPKAPLLHYRTPSGAKKASHSSYTATDHGSSTLFPTSLPSPLQPLGATGGCGGGGCGGGCGGVAGSEPQRSCINSPTGGRVTLVGGAGGNGAVSYGTLQHPKSKANVEVVIKSSLSEGDVARV